MMNANSPVVSFCLLTLAYLAASAPAQEPSPETPSDPTSAPDLRARVELSDGQTFEGRVYFRAPGEPLKFWDLRQQRYRHVALSELAFLETWIDRAVIERQFVFKEESSNEKVFSGHEFPRHDYLHVLTLRNGEVFEAHVVGSFYLETSDDEPRERFTLQKKQVGADGQSLDELRYVARIVFEGKRRSGADSRVSALKVAFNGEQVARRAVILASDRGDAFEAKISGNELSFSPLLPGRYDLAVETEQALLVGMGEGARAAPELSGEDFAALRDRVREIPNYFPVREVLIARGTRNRALAVVSLSRDVETTSADKEVRGKDLEPFRFRRIELWVLRFNAPRWVVERRLFLMRDRVSDLHPGRPVILCDALAGLPVPDDRDHREIALPGALPLPSPD